MRLFFFSAISTLAFCGAASAQNLAPGTPVWANVVSSCGSASYSAGQPYIVTQDATGKLCTGSVSLGSGTAVIGALAPYGSSQTAVSAASGNVANAAATATMAAVTAKTNYVCGAEFSASGATAGSVVNPTISGLLGGTVTYTFAAPTGATSMGTPLLLQFTPCLPASAVNTAITATLPALGTGNTNATVSLHGFYQ